MTETTTMIYNIIEIIAAICGALIYLYKHKSRLLSFLTPILGKLLPSLSQAIAKLLTRFNLVKTGLVVFVIVILLSSFSIGLSLWPSFVAQHYQDLLNQQVAQPPTYSFSLAGFDKRWSVGQPYGSSGRCSFQNQAYDVLMTAENHFYPCYLNIPLHNFMVQFSMQIQRGDGGGILLRASSQEGTGFYYLYLSTDGAYNLQYWPNDTGGKSAISLERGLSDTFYMDQVLRHWSVVTVVAQAENFAIYIDRSYVASVRDKSVSSGHIGLIAQKEINDTEISYKQVQIWTL